MDSVATEDANSDAVLWNNGSSQYWEKLILLKPDEKVRKVHLNSS